MTQQFWQRALQRVLGGRSRVRPRAGRSVGRPRARVNLERLEDRIAPSTLTVTNLLDGGAGSLRDQVAAAASGDTIAFAVQGTITLTGGELDVTTNLTIQGPGAGNVTVSGNHAGRVFHTAAGANVTISGLTIANGSVADLGAGIDSEGSLTLLNSTLTNNDAGAGGGVAFAAGNGGAVLTVSGSTFTNNRAADGAGLYSSVTNRSGQVTVTVTSSTFSGNTATGPGGGIDSRQSLSGSAGATFTVTGGTISGNHAASGGALATTLSTADVSQGAATLSGILVQGNTAHDGGGISSEVTSADASQATTTFSGDTLATNTAAALGGGFLDTVTSTEAGRASLSFTGSATAVVQANTAQSGAGIYSRVNTTGSGSAAAAFNSSNVVANVASQSGGGLFSLVRNSGTGTASVALSGGSVSANDAVASFGGGIESAVDVSGTGSSGATLSGVTVTANVAGSDGGGLHAQVTNSGGGSHLNSASTAVTSCTVSGNTSGDGPDGGSGGGGGIFLTVTANGIGAANATLTGVTASANTSSRGSGGGIFADLISRGRGPATVSISSTTASGNVAGVFGGGLLARMTATAAGTVAVTVSNSTLTGNTAANGGGVYAAVGTTGLSPLASARLTLTGSTVSGNRATSGAGVYFSIGTLNAGGSAGASVTASTISGNGATDQGGGVYADEETVSADAAATVTLTNSTLYGNSAASGGGLYNTTRAPAGAVAAVTLLSDTVAFNRATSGGGLDRASGQFTVRSTVVAANSAGSGADVLGSFVSGGHNLVGQTNGSSGWLPGDLTGTSASPLDARFGDFGNFGGPTRTLALQGDSPAVGSGDPAGPATDQRGLARTRTRPSSGAFEVALPDAFLVAPAVPSVRPGTAFSATVSALDSTGALLTAYTGTIHFTSSDAGAVLPGDYTFTPADAGRHTFPQGVTLQTAGAQTLAVTGNGVTGTATITVTAPARWIPLGPAPILRGQTPGAQPVSGRISAIAADPVDPGTIYLAAAGGGVWKTTDAGAHWAPLTDDQATLFMGAIALAPSDPNVLYAGTGEATNSALSYTGHGVLKSTDAGQSWALLGADVFDRHTISQVVVAPDNPDVVYVAVAGSGVHGVSGNTGVWRSTDGGATWANTTATISTTAAFSDVEINPADPQTLYAAVGSFRGSAVNGVYKSTDGGDSWAVAGNFPMEARDGRITVALAPSAPQTLYASVSGSGQGGSSLGRLVHLLKSSDGGATWADVPNLPDVGGQGWYGLPLAVDPSDPNTVYASGGGDPIVESTDGGATWFSLVAGADGNGPHPDHHAFAFDANGKLLDGNDGGIWRLDVPTRGSLRWADLNSDLQLTQYIGVAVNPTDPNIAYGGSQDNGTSEFTGSPAWTLIRAGDGGFVRIDPAHPRTVYHEYVNIDLERSDDGGFSWVQKSTGINRNDPHDTYVPYVMDPVNPLRLLLGTDRVYETTNRGDLWRPISQPGQGGWTVSSNIDSLAVAASDPNTTYASAGGHLFVTFDDGATWQQRDIPGVTDHLQDIQIDPADSRTAFAVRDRFGGGHVFMTTDGGVTWADVSGNLPDLPAYTLALDAASRTLYAGTDDGVYASADQGGSWSRFGAGLPHAQVRELELLPQLHLLASGTHGRGMWEMLLEEQTAPPPVTSVVLKGSARRSPVASVPFSEVVNLDPGAFQLTRQGAAVPVAGTVAVGGGQGVGVLTVSGPGVTAGPLPDGRHTRTTAAAKGHDAARTDDFFRLFGASGGDGKVDFRDLLLFGSAA